MLTAASDYFNSIFSKHETEFHLNFVESETLDKIIRFCYIGQINLTLESIEHIVNIAHELRMHQLKSVCGEFLEKTSISENCLKYALISERCGLTSSNRLAKKFLADNCDKIRKSNQVRSLSSTHIDSVIENLCKNQCEIFDILIDSLNSGGSENNSLLMNLYQAIYRSFVGYFVLHSSLNFPKKFVLKYSFVV